MYSLIVIGGNPGSGKTTISTMLEKYHFIRLGIDDFYQRTPRNPDVENWFEDDTFLDQAYSYFKKEIIGNLRQGKRVVIETTGVGNRWKNILMELESQFSNQIITIYLETPPETSKKRIHERNKTDYPIKMTEERLDAFFTLGKDTPGKYQHVIDANKPLTEVFDSVISLIG